MTELTPGYEHDKVAADSRRWRLRWPHAGASESLPFRLRLAFAAASAVGVAVFAWIVTGETFNLFGRTIASGGPPEGFYDAQAVALLHGSLAVPRAAIGGEAFLIHGKAFGYFGPTPALLRIPILTILPSAQGHLNALFMLAAFSTTLFFASRLMWDVRRLDRGQRAPTLLEIGGLSGLLTVLAIGTTVIYLATYSLPYHESILWGIAWTLATFSYAIRFLFRPCVPHVIALSITTALALLARATVGLTSIAVLVGLLLISVGSALAQRDRLVRARRCFEGIIGIGETSAIGRLAGLLALATVCPAVLYAAVNYAKFGSFVSIPYNHHVVFITNPARYKQALANGGLLNLRYLPGNFLQYIRPDSLRTSPLFPWLVFRFPPDLVANPLGVHLDGIEPHSSITTTMPAMVGLTAIGVASALRTHKRRRPLSHSSTRLLIFAATLAVLGSWSFAGLTQRYLGETIPLLTLGAVLGIYALAEWRRRHRVLGTLAGVVLIVAGVFSVLVNIGLSVDYQHTFVRTPPSAQLSYRAFQEHVARIVDTAFG